MFMEGSKGTIKLCYTIREIQYMVKFSASASASPSPIKIGLHQGSALSPYLFALVMDEVTRDIQGDIPGCMLFADDVVLVDESRAGVNRKLELW